MFKNTRTNAVEAIDSKQKNKNKELFIKRQMIMLTFKSRQVIDSPDLSNEVNKFIYFTNSLSYASKYINP